MATVVSNPYQVGNKQWKYEWTGTAPFRIFNYDTYSYIHGNFSGTSIVVSNQSNLTPPALEIFDATETDTPEGITYPAQVFAQWRGVSLAKEYKVYDSDAATTIATIPENGKGYYQFLGMSNIDDGDTVNYSINVVDNVDTESTAVNQTFDLYRNPDPVKLSIAYDSGTNTFTITEGSD